MSTVEIRACRIGPRNYKRLKFFIQHRHPTGRRASLFLRPGGEWQESRYYYSTRANAEAAMATLALMQAAQEN